MGLALAGIALLCICPFGLGLAVGLYRQEAEDAEFDRLMRKINRLLDDLGKKVEKFS